MFSVAPHISLQPFPSCLLAMTSLILKYHGLYKDSPSLEQGGQQIFVLFWQI